MTLEDKDIIQVDATVIIGVMILLTLSIGFDSSINKYFRPSEGLPVPPNAITCLGRLHLHIYICPKAEYSSLGNLFTQANE